MKKDRSRIQDLEMLSAYLDDALTAAERQTLEARLVRDPELREHLEQLRVTRSLVRGLPRIKAPRNFTLSAEMVRLRRPKARPMVSLLRLASSLAAILLVVLFGLESLGRVPPLLLAAGEIATDETALTAETPEPLILWADPASGEEAFGMGGEEGAMPEMIEVFPQEAPEAAPEEGVAGPDQATPVVEEPKVGAPEAEAAEESRGADAMPILGLNPEEGGEIVERSMAESPPESEGLSPLRWLQMGLGLVALVGVLTLFFLKRR